MAGGPLGDLPGFTWDEEREGYFAINTTPLSTPASAPYDQHNVRRRKTKKKRQKLEEEHELRRARETVKRSRILSNPLSAVSSWTLRREISNPTTSRMKGRENVFASGLQLKTFEPKFDIRSMFATNQAFDYDSATQTVLIGTGKQELLFTKRGAERYEKAQMLIDSDICSLQITPHRRVLITTRGGRSPPRVSLSTLKPVGEDFDGDPFADGSVHWQLEERGKLHTIWSTAVNKFSGGDVDTIAIGSSAQVLLLEASPTGFLDLGTAFKTAGDILALEWLSTNILAVGKRNGTMVLWDRRAKAGALRINHTPAITGIKRAGSEDKLVVAGFANSMDMYDLRMPVDESALKKRSSGKLIKTLPLFSFQDYENEYSYPCGLDVHEDLGLVATARTEEEVQLNSLKTGEVVRRMQQPRDVVFDGMTFPPAPTNLKFVEETVGAEAGTVKLFAGTCHQLFEWGW